MKRSLSKSKENSMELEMYAGAKHPDLAKLKADILRILKREINRDLIRLADLRARVASKIKAKSFFALLQHMQDEELVMVSGEDPTWAVCGAWEHPRLIEWRIELEKWERERQEDRRREAEERRKWEIENAPRLARERFQRELAEFFADNSGQLFDVVKRVIQSYSPRKISLSNSRIW